jgi:hypothetical protein
VTRGRPTEWTRETIIDAIRDFHADTGRVPASTDFDAPNYLPALTTVRRHFASLRDANKAAELPLAAWRRSRVLPQLATVAVVGATLAVGSIAYGQQLPPVELPSPGIIRAVADETARSGWPHPPTGRERDRIARRVLAALTPTGHRAYASCRWGNAERVSPVRCVTRVYGVDRSAEQIVRVITTRVRVFEDGAWRQWAVR